jgi:TRAP-type uncharacterized transport system fused permease subunit
MLVWKDRAMKVGDIPAADIIFGSILALLVLEAARRTNGLFLTLTAAFFIVYALLGPYFPTFMAQYLEQPYAAVCIAAIVPAFLYYMALLCVVDARAVRSGLTGLPKDQLPLINSFHLTLTKEDVVKTILSRR